MMIVLLPVSRFQCEDGGDHVALAVQRDGLWTKWTYQQYLEDIRTAAKAFIRLGLEPHHGNVFDSFFAHLPFKI